MEPRPKTWTSHDNLRIYHSPDNLELVDPQSVNSVLIPNLPKEEVAEELNEYSSPVRLSRIYNYRNMTMKNMLALPHGLSPINSKDRPRKSVGTVSMNGKKIMSHCGDDEDGEDPDSEPEE